MKNWGSSSTHLIRFNAADLDPIYLVFKIEYIIFKKFCSLCTCKPNKKKRCVSGNGSENFSRIGTHIFFSGNKYNFMHFERHFPYQNT